MSAAPGPATTALSVGIGQKSLKASPVRPASLLVSGHLNVLSPVFTFGELAKLSPIEVQPAFLQKKARVLSSV